jgi:hypothetical protein
VRRFQVTVVVRQNAYAHGREVDGSNRRASRCSPSGLSPEIVADFS